MQERVGAQPDAPPERGSSHATGGAPHQRVERPGLHRQRARRPARGKIAFEQHRRRADVAAEEEHQADRREEDRDGRHQQHAADIRGVSSDERLVQLEVVER